MMESSLKKQSYNSLDIAKLLMAICVVAIHTHPLENVSTQWVNAIYESIVTLAVPFFFLCSGFLLAKKMIEPYNSEENIPKIKATLLRITKMYLIWSLIYLPLAVYGYYLEQYSFVKSVVYYIRGLLLIGEHYNSYPLWYLLSTIFACIFILALYKLKLSHKSVVIIGFVIIVIAFATSHLVLYEGNLPKILDLYKKVVSHTTINGRIFFGIFYFPFGMTLAKKDLNLPVSLALFAVGFAGHTVFIQNVFISNLFLLICSIGFFEIVLKIKLKDSSTYFVFRKMSTGVFLIHMYVWTVFYLLVYHKPAYGALPFAVTAIVSLMLSFIYAKTKKLG